MTKRGHERRTADEVFLTVPDDPEGAAEAERTAVAEASANNRVAGRPYSGLYDDVLWNYRYLGNTLYSALIRGYLASFGPEQILVLFFEEMISDVVAARNALGTFLGVDPQLFPQEIGKDNRTHRPDLSTPWGRLIEQARWVKRGNLTLVRPSEITASPLRSSIAVREKLDRIFASEVAYWSQYAGRDLRAIGWGRGAAIGRAPAASDLRGGGGAPMSVTDIGSGGSSPMA
jgi:hypothetical protein